MILLNYMKTQKYLTIQKRLSNTRSAPEKLRSEKTLATSGCQAKHKWY